ncbi:unnamed protein product [Soboliphyme baturini]|uniref:DHC_N1 domain-containing protein n=1 Tax=Soboliphyme baturini TaxID=241478 RepID=A0A183IB06_9BILA|nr:unnamed protein product [Soboliphyme baturini]
MQFTHKTGILQVNYSDRLVTLLRDVRQLQGLGYNIPSKIQTCFELGQKFYKQAITLKQVMPVAHLRHQRTFLFALSHSEFLWLICLKFKPFNLQVCRICSATVRYRSLCLIHNI